MWQRKNVFVVTVIFLMAVFLWVSNAVFGRDHQVRLNSTAVSSSISYQGYLTDNSGNPLSGSYNMKFELFNTATGGTALWQQSSTVLVEDGLVDLVLNIDAALFNGQALWLGITANGQQLSPRQELLPSPYALTLRPGAEISDDLDDPTLLAYNTGSGVGVHGGSDGSYGVVGQTTANTEWVAAGVYGSSEEDRTFGVLGESDLGIGVEGYIGNPSNNNTAVFGFNEGGGDGVGGYSAQGTGISGSTDSAVGFGGYFENNVVGGAGLYAQGGDDWSADIILGGQDADDDGTLYSDPTMPGSDLVLVSNDATAVVLDANNDEEGNFLVLNGSNDIVFEVNEQGDTNITGDLTVQGKFFGPQCAQHDFSSTGDHSINVPAYCQNQMCWVIVESDAIIGAFGPGLFWPILYMQDTASNAWIGGPNLNIAGGSLSEGMGVNGDGTTTGVVGGGVTSSGGQWSVWDDKGAENSSDQWTLELQLYPSELSYVSVYICPLGEPELVP